MEIEGRRSADTFWGRGVTLARVAAVRCQFWLIEASGLANTVEVRGCWALSLKSEGFGWAGLAHGPSIKVRDLDVNGWPSAYR